jgi:two-component system aerobic respiration control sensor histidine kinase ArcB
MENIIIFLLGALFGTTMVFVVNYVNRKIRMKNPIDLREIMAKLPEHVYWKNKDGVILGSNDLNARSAGLSCGTDIVGKTDYDLFSREEADILRKNDQEIIHTGISKIVEEPMTLPNGNVAIYLSHKIPLQGRNKEIIGILGISIDITNTREKEMERLEALENIIALMPGHVYWKDKNGVFLGCNNEQAKSIGSKSRKEIVGLTAYDTLSKDFANAVTEHDRYVMYTKTPQTMEETLKLPDGTQSVWLSKKVPLYNKQKEISGILGISFDITEKKRTEKLLQETNAKLDGMTLMSATIAHELRTPLRAINSSAGGLKKHLPDLLTAYRAAKQANLPIPNINPLHQKSLDPLLDVIELETRSAFTVIEMLLIRLNQEERQKDLVVCSMDHCVEETLKRYPFNRGERELIHWQAGSDFLFKGKELLVVHILFNLLKNSLYSMKAAGKGEIYIDLEQGTEMNNLYFKDTGTGIATDILPHIFDQFFSKTHHGTGVGLSFCKTVMHSFGGDIICQSKEDEYTAFILSFPTTRNVE